MSSGGDRRDLNAALPTPPRKDRDGRGLGFLVAVFVVITIAVAASFVVYSSLPPREPPANNLVFQSPMLVDGNASFVVKNVSGGPYAYTGFRVNLVVNNFAGQRIPLAASNSPARIMIGPNTYRISWLDSDGDGAVGVGDPFVVSGDGAPLPPLSHYEFDLQWQASWTAKAFWSTY